MSKKKKKGTALTVSQTALRVKDPNTLTRDRVELLKSQVAVGASDDELRLFMLVAQKAKLDPFMKQIYFVKRYDNKTRTERGTFQVGIDGLRSIAERTGQYAGNDDPTFDDELNPKKATVTVYRIVNGVRCGFSATARWAHYYPGKDDSDPKGFMWRKMPHLMLGKCAEALALRKAFPQVMSGLVIHEEMQQADREHVASTVPDTEAGQVKKTQLTETQLFEKFSTIVRNCEDQAQLEDWADRLKTSKLYTPEHNKTLANLILDQLTKLADKSTSQHAA